MREFWGSGVFPPNGALLPIENLMQTIELASYPKSGNTWFRHIVKDFLLDACGENIFPPDIHQQGEEGVLSTAQCFSLQGIAAEFVVYKSHIPAHPAIKPDKIIHIQRHPLDVFLSALNNFFIAANKGKMAAQRREKIFINGQPKSVSDIYADGELDHYFQEFICNAGLNYYFSMLKSASNYFEYQRRVSLLDNCFSITYEDLIGNFDNTVQEALSFMFGEAARLGTVSAERVDSKTKHSGKEFFWSAVSGNYKNFLDEEQINQFYDRYGEELSVLGYA